ncbi:MAG: hypothetical protein V8R80_09405 [Eubacterium sp.]
MGLLVGAMDVATANNTVAIVMANPIAKEMARDYDISPKKAASILATFSCVAQGIIPYGAQMLVALAAATELVFAISAFDIIPTSFIRTLRFYVFLYSFLLYRKKGKQKIRRKRRSHSITMTPPGFYQLFSKFSVFIIASCKLLETLTPDFSAS